MAVTLNPQDISNFTVVGPAPATGADVRFTDADPQGASGLFANDADAATGKEVDLEATFQVNPQDLNGVDAGFQLAINDGPSGRAAVAACLLINGMPHIGLVGAGSRDLITTYPAFVAAEWQAAPLTLKLRRTADGGAQLLELNGAPPPARVELLPGQLGPKTRDGTTSELGCFSDPATLGAVVSRFFTQLSAQPTQGALTFTRFRIRDTDSVDRVAFRADFQLGASTNGIDPTTETVTIKLQAGTAEFYAQTLNGFNVRGQTPRRRWVLNDSERARTGIEQLIIEEDPNNTGSIFLRDVRTDCGMGPFNAVKVEVTIGTGPSADILTGSAELTQRPPDSNRWRLVRER